MTEKRQLERKLLKEELNQLNMSATPQRLAILEFLRGDRSHPDAEGVLSHLRETYFDISKTTVYRILEEFCQQGLIQPFQTDGKRRRYDGNRDPHHHLVCNQCGNIIDVYLEDKQLARIGAREARGFSLERQTVTFFGICADCQTKN